MIKKVILLIFIILIFPNKKLIAEINIIALVDNEIITNHDVKKESNYIKILNPNFNQLDKNQRFNIAKNYLIDQIIKKKEAKKFINIESNNEIIDDYLKNMISKLNLKNEKEFENLLNQKDNYTLNEIKEKINTDLLWNELIYLRYNNQVKIDKEQILKKVNELQNKKNKEYLLSEIIFTKKKGVGVKKLFDEIKLSIQEIGFDNTANIFSKSESAKFGGKLGWISEISLTKNINKILKTIKKGEHTDLIKLGNNFLILKVNDVRSKTLDIDENEEIERLTKLETNSQLNKFSKIYFDKIKLNYLINEK